MFDLEAGAAHSFFAEIVLACEKIISELLNAARLGGRSHQQSSLAVQGIADQFSVHKRPQPPEVHLLCTASSASGGGYEMATVLGSTNKIALRYWTIDIFGVVQNAYPTFYPTKILRKSERPRASMSTLRGQRSLPIDG